MTGARRAAAIAAVLLATAGAVGCTVSEDQEAQMGAEDAAQINEQLPLVRDPAINDYLTALGDSIARKTSRADLDWHFYMVDSPEVNAFALPGGFIYVNRGLVERADRVDELAGVLGHEIGHVVRRHSIKAMQQAQKANVGIALACTLTKVCQSNAAQVAINVGGTALFARHSRLDESQADSEAVGNVVRAGYDPEGIPALFQILIAERRRSPTIVDAFFASHPLEEKRVADAERIIGGLDPASLHGLVQDTPAYHAFRRRLESLPPSPVPQGAQEQIVP
ncbi:MAG TPA: M48 family metallopeptidase [Gemmatimonadaceae bacterium]|nr:M48 family metallopeptidase [Gemmatimonadaceae bacterium]